MLWLLLCLVCLESRGENAEQGADELVIFVGFPKSGTTSYTHLFQEKLHMKTAHFSKWSETGSFTSQCRITNQTIPAIKLKTGVEWVQTRHHNRMCYFGELVQFALAEGRKPFYYMENMGYRVFTQYDCDICGIYPQLDALEDILHAYPSARFIHNIRDIKRHVRSILKWGNFTNLLRSAGKLSSYPGQSTSYSDARNVEALLNYARKHTRRVFSMTPDIKFLEISIDMGSEAVLNILRFLHISYDTNLTLEEKNSNAKALNFH